MATYKPIVINNGEFQQLQSGNDLIINDKLIVSSGSFPRDSVGDGIQVVGDQGITNDINWHTPGALNLYPKTADDAAGTTGITFSGRRVSDNWNATLFAIRSVGAVGVASQLQFWGANSGPALNQYLTLFSTGGVHIGGTTNPGGGSLLVAKHFGGAGTVPTIARNAAEIGAGSTQTFATGSFDTQGIISITPGQQTSASFVKIATVTFAAAYTNPPAVLLAPVDGPALFYAKAISTTIFEIWASQVLFNGVLYKIAYGIFGN